MIKKLMKTKKGQILLVVAMGLTVMLTVVLAVSFQSQNNTKSTKLEEESEKVISAAESAASRCGSAQANMA